MSDNGNKRYYWLKLSEDFFRQKEIKQLRRMAGGDTFTIIYLKMLLRSLEDGGRLYYEGIEQDFVSELALDLDEELENVKLTVAYLTAKGILIHGGSDEYELLTAGEMTGSETASTRRSRKSRANRMTGNGQKLLQCNADATKRNTEIEIDTDIDTDIESVSATPKKSAPVRHKYGEYKNVLLSDEEADKLRADLPNGQFERYIESLSGHIASKGASYKSHYATIRNWYKRDQEKSAAPPQSKLQTGRYDNSNASYDLDEWEKYAKDFDPGAETM